MRCGDMVEISTKIEEIIGADLMVYWRDNVTGEKWKGEV